MPLARSRPTYDRKGKATVTAPAGLVERTAPAAYHDFLGVDTSIAVADTSLVVAVVD